MAQPQIIFDAGLKFDPQQLAGQFSAIEKNIQKINGSVGNLGKGGLGQIARDFSAFDKSLESANARVLAFGVSAGAGFVFVVVLVLVFVVVLSGAGLGF